MGSGHVLPGLIGRLEAGCHGSQRPHPSLTRWEHPLLFQSYSDHKVPHEAGRFPPRYPDVCVETGVLRVHCRRTNAFLEQWKRIWYVWHKANHSLHSKQLITQVEYSSHFLFSNVKNKRNDSNGIPNEWSWNEKSSLKKGSRMRVMLAVEDVQIKDLMFFEQSLPAIRQASLSATLQVILYQTTQSC